MSASAQAPEVPGISEVDFDTDRLKRYLADVVDGLRTEQVQFHRIAGGQSNPTYLMQAGAHKYVLRKQPGGKLLPSAHAVDREYAIQKSLHGLAVPVPRMIHLCTDREVIGTLFYVMEFVEGRVLNDPSLSAVPAGARKDYFDAAARTLAALHTIVPDPGVFNTSAAATPYFSRQLLRWTANYRAAVSEENRDMEDVIRWLGERGPHQDVRRIAHGDFRLGNLLFAPDSADVRAVLDWELTALGPPVADLAYSCLPFRLPSFTERGFAELDHSSLGLPSEKEYVNAYLKAGGPADIEELDAYVVLALFRSAAILAGVHRRSLQGNAASADAHRVGQRYSSYAKVAATIAQGLA